MNRALFFALLIALATTALLPIEINTTHLAHDGDAWCNDELECAPIPDKMPIGVLYCNKVVCKARQAGTGGGGWWMLAHQMDTD